MMALGQSGAADTIHPLKQGSEQQQAVLCDMRPAAALGNSQHSCTWPMKRRLDGKVGKTEQ